MVKTLREFCPQFYRCNNGGLDPKEGFQCVMASGHQVAKNTVDNNTTVEQEMEVFRSKNIHPPKGWMYSPDRREFTIISDGEEIFELVERFAYVALSDSASVTQDNPSS
jgi:hypothetical protein